MIDVVAVFLTVLNFMSKLIKERTFVSLFIILFQFLLFTNLHQS